jgi:hypothetical protein
MTTLLAPTVSAERNGTRDCSSIQEQEQQEWAEQIHDLRLRMAAAAEAWWQRGAQAVPGYERDEWIAQ